MDKNFNEEWEHYNTKKFAAGLAMDGIGTQIVYDFNERYTTTSWSVMGITLEHTQGGQYGNSLFKNWFLGVDVAVSGGVGIGGEAGMRGGITTEKEK